MHRARRRSTATTRRRSPRCSARSSSIRWPSPPTARSCASTRPPGAASRRSRSTSSCASSSTPSWRPSPTPRRAALYRELLAPEPATDTRGNLPQPLTSFVGRERERGEIVRLLDRVRLLTLIGPGGCGKTRLAIETLARIEPVPDGIWFVELAGLDRRRARGPGHGRWPSASRSRRSARRRRRSPRTWPRARRSSCSTTASTSSTPARAWPRTCCAPGPACACWPRAASRCTARARSPGASRRWRRRAACSSSAPPPTRGFSPTGEDEATIDEICRRLDGMPLAIELAAARVAALSLDQIAARLGDSLDVLAAGSRTARTRQQTLRATIEWSHDLLTGEERVLFRRLSRVRRRLHAGGGRGRVRRRRHRPAPDRRPHRAAGRQVARQRHRTGASACSTPSASTRPSASTPPREHDTVAVRHLDWCLALAEEHDPLSAGPRRSLRTLETEHDNLRAALTFALRRDPQAALRLATSLWRFWLDRGYFAEGNRWLEATLVAAPERTALRVEALLASAGLSLRSGDSDAYLRPRRSRRSPTTASWATSTRRPRPSTSTRCSSSRSATPRAPTRSSPTRSPSRRRLGDRRLLAAAIARFGHDAVVPLRPRAGARGRSPRRSRSSRALPDDDTPFFERRDLRAVPAGRRAAGAPAPALRGDDLRSSIASPAPRPSATPSTTWRGPRARRATWRAAAAALDEALERFRADRGRRGRGPDPQPHGQPRPHRWATSTPAAPTCARRSTCAASSARSARSS